MVITFEIYNIFLTGYVLCFIFFNYVTYLIASFYRGKFNQDLLRAGFIIAMVLYGIFIPCIFIEYKKIEICNIIKLIALICGSIASAWNAVVLYLTMRRVRK